MFKNPIALLLMTGILIGFNFPLGKIAGEAQVSPILWSLIVSLGASGFLLPPLLINRKFSIPDRKILVYIMISGLISFVIPNLLLFSAIPHAGAGYTGLMFALSPVFTLTLATLFKIKAPNKLGIIGIAIGLIGAVVVSITRGASLQAPPVIWLLAALLIPMSLACGNIYRTLAWPKGASPDILAFWSHAFSTIVFAVILLTTTGAVNLADAFIIPKTLATQLLVAGLTFPIFFRLQKIGGPVLLSQIGYVAAAIGLLSATLFLDETYSLLTWLGAAIIAVGILVTIWAQTKLIAT
ncbi:MAG: DMT family transporter [Alphaproteobacteria bacterium]|nr:DMT family transporter [Alphaproteobacteria bacterium]